MEDLKIEINRYSPTMCEVLLRHEATTIDLGMLNEDEQKALVQAFDDAISEMDWNTERENALEVEIVALKQKVEADQCRIIELSTARDLLVAERDGLLKQLTR